MNKTFIRQKKTYKNQDRDFTDWHKGRERYAVWAIDIDEKSWGKNLKSARDLLKPYLLEGRHRSAHITLFACGFFYELNKINTFSEMIKAQVEDLKKANLSPLSIELSSLDSFLSAPYFSIICQTNSINEIREIMARHSNEDRAEVYRPHLTVGLYNDAYSTHLLSDKIRLYQPEPAKEILVTKISLMSYATKSIFSPLKTEFQLELK